MSEDLKNFIEDNKDIFDKHVVKKIDLPTGGEHDCYISFRDPATCNGAMEFIYIGGYLTIQGDYGNASFTWYNPRNSIEVMAGFAENFGYFMSKTSSAERSSIPNTYFTDWDGDLCVDTIRKELKDLEEHGYTFENSDNDWEDCTESFFEWIAFLQENGSKYFGDDWCEFAPKAGYKIENRAYCLVYGFIKAVEALQTKAQPCT